MPNNPITVNTANRMILDAGALYKDYGGTPVLIGATKGGAVWTVERDDREVEVDGARGPIVGLVRKVRETARLEVTLVEISLQTLQDLLGDAVVASDGTHKTITPDLTIADSDYDDNIALVATSSGSSDPVVLSLLNALHRGEWSITTVDKEEAGLSLIFVAHYAIAAVETVPYEILLPIGAS